ncbi:undecaprenyldiphospho-muramoylpentapeptide beta-N-acetylglucosaminyltransferase [Nocardiopsis aegyptia]|uniref:UDP-N-acetylglucosamine--N-acetylmuramyl-(pentapeptide) pyrophosphoryl-undecaprenol N-acetylglucosamine transferase n=1 Tax=Nocardiopsis aegyptia TaxID=220378 RepID=A0A7Z0EKI2_9ACTN|nr:undecaprenyldiphospho-muramoylpentapeptide beta-N-acetylglucosaminyltransferase [Nocardiopsis aegyptia]NYJ33306.1 UDP-N-acetylglucosamine--N-acetylmuramyl-(pentapeptide) pyrophosphoryl-undecaprenol N-acetylglucosamine transferase [Nocardiopsis aegyptia]
MRVALAGGGTAGHIEPALSLADALRRLEPSTEILCLGTERGLETRLVPMRGYELGLIPAVPLPRKLTPKLLTVPGKLAGALSAAGDQLDRLQADILVGFGGYVATPGYLAARRRRIPTVVHEANPLPGLANRLGARLTPHVYTGHPHAQIRNGRFIGIPLRRQISTLDRLAMGDKARAFFGLRHDLPTLLIFGGSQGAQRLNETAFASRPYFRDRGVQVLHVVGPKNADEPQDLTEDGIPYVAVPYVDRMDMAYAAADVAMCRSGAMTCAELTAVGLPGAFVPLAIGNGEQAKNAEPIVSAGGGLMVHNSDISVEWIAGELIPLLTDTDRVVTMSEAAARMGRRDADEALAREVLAIARGDNPTPEIPIQDDDADDEAFYDDGKDAR